MSVIYHWACMRLIIAVLAALPLASQVVDIGNRKQLFIDHQLMQMSEGILDASSLEDAGLRAQRAEQQPQSGAEQRVIIHQQDVHVILRCRA